MKFKFEIGGSLLRRTLITTGILVGACIIVEGALTGIALGVASHAVGPATPDKAANAGTPSDTPSTPGMPGKRAAGRPATAI